MYRNEWGDAGAKQTYVQWLEMEVYRLRAVAPAQQATAPNNARDAMVAEVVESFGEWDLLPDLFPTDRMLNALHTLADASRCL